MWYIAACVVWVIALVYAIRLLLRWRHRRFIARLQAAYEQADTIELPDGCYHGPWPTEECIECHRERDILDAGDQLPDPDQPHPLPLPSWQAMDILKQLPREKWVPPWSLEFGATESEPGTMLALLWEYGMIRTRDGRLPRAGAEAEIMLTARGWEARGGDRMIGNVWAVTEKHTR